MQVTLEPPAWAVKVVSDLTDWQRAPVAVTDLQPFTLPDDAYFEYAYLTASGQPRPDPDNPHPPLNPWWDYARSLFGPEYRTDPYAEVGGERPRGQVRRLRVASQILAQERHCLVYSPAGHAESSLPLVMFQDGKAYYGWGKVPQVFDRLLANGQVKPAHLVFVPPQERTQEYAFNETYRQFLVTELMPAVEARSRCNGQRVAWGASLGGLLSAILSWEHPDRFQKVVTQSGAFLFSPDQDLGDPFQGREWFRRQIASAGPAQARQLRWYLECGSLEWLLASNQRLAQVLGDNGAQVKLQVRSAGHNWVNWRNGLASAFRFALG
jgi:enterochelin esterase family protein